MNKSRDREWSKLKITATMAGVDEVDDVDEDGYDTLYSRTGRRNETGAPRVMISCCNPNDKWTKHKIYYPYLKSIGRQPDNMTDEEWDLIEPLPSTKMVIEFEMEDSFLYNTGYYDRFLTRPMSWIARYLRNNWSYFDDSDALFKTRPMDMYTIDRLKAGDKYIGVDPNAGGKDRCSIALWEGDCLVHVDVYSTEDLDRLALPDEEGNYGAIIGRLTVEMMQAERVGYQNVCGDVVGIGQGWLTYMLSNGYRVEQFSSGAAPYQTPREVREHIKPPYQILRDQMFHMWSLDIENGNTFFYANMPHLSSLKKELQLHGSDTTNKVMRVTPKDEIRKLLGGSPDIADSAMMGYWVRMIRKGRSSDAPRRASVGKSVDQMYSSSNG
jgi:phage terminase large subunit